MTISPFERTCETSILYGEAAGEKLLLDIYRPVAEGEDAPSSVLRPCIVYFHGGGWVQGSRAGPSGVGYGCELSAEGYVVVSVDYRLGPRHRAPAAIEDCRRAVRWVRAHASDYAIDPSKIIVMGTSAGGHLAAMVALAKPEHGFDGEGDLETDGAVRAAICLCGIMDVAELALGDDPRPWAEAWLPLDREDVHALAVRCSPLTHASADAPPMLIVHGDADPYVPHAQAVRFTQAIERAGGDAQLVTLAGAGHFLTILGPVDVQRRIRSARREFLARVLGEANGA